MFAALQLGARGNSRIEDHPQDDEFRGWFGLRPEPSATAGADVTSLTWLGGALRLCGFSVIIGSLGEVPGCMSTLSIASNSERPRARVNFMESLSP